MSITYETLATMDAKAYYKNEFYPLLKDTNGKNVDIVILAQCLLKNKKKEDLLTIGCIDPLPSNSKTRVKCKFDKAAKKVTIFTADKLAAVQDIFDRYKIELKSYAVEGEPEIAVSEEDVNQAKAKLKAELIQVANFIKQGYAKLEVRIPQEISDSVKLLSEGFAKAVAIGDVKQLFDRVGTLRKTVEEDLARLANATEITVQCKLQYEIKPSNSAYPLDSGNLILIDRKSVV